MWLILFASLWSRLLCTEVEEALRSCLDKETVGNFVYFKWVHLVKKCLAAQPSFADTVQGYCHVPARHDVRCLCQTGWQCIAQTPFSSCKQPQPYSPPLASFIICTSWPRLLQFLGLWLFGHWCTWSKWRLFQHGWDSPSFHLTGHQLTTSKQPLQTIHK